MRSIALLKALYPTTLAEFRARDAFSVQLPDSLWDFDTRSIAVLSLAAECDIPSVVPAAFYCASTQETEVYFEDAVPPGPGELRYRLSPTDLRVLVLGKTKLPEVIRNGPLRFLVVPPECGAASCRNAFRNEIDEFWFENMISDQWAFGEYPWEILEDSVCASCLSSARRMFSEAQTRLWEELPTLFGFQGWDQFRSPIQN
jgi:hypothetical protein